MCPSGDGENVVTDLHASGFTGEAAIKATHAITQELQTLSDRSVRLGAIGELERPAREGSARSGDQDVREVERMACSGLDDQTFLDIGQVESARVLDQDVLTGNGWMEMRSEALPHQVVMPGEAEGDRVECASQFGLRMIAMMSWLS